MRGISGRISWARTAIVGIAVVSLVAAGTFAGSGRSSDEEARAVHKGKMKVVVVEDDGNRHEESYAFDGDTPRPFLGVMIRPGAEEGATVDRVIEDSAAKRAGLLAGDVIVGFDGQAIDGPADLTRRILGSEVGARIDLDVLRDGKRRTMHVELGEGAGFMAWAPGFDGERLREHLDHMRESLEGLDLDLHFDAEGEMLEFEHALEFMHSRRPKLGVQLTETTPELREHLGAPRDSGVLVGKVLSGTPAEAAGVLVGDVIVAVGDERIESAGDLIHVLREADGETLRLELVRDGRSMSLDVSIPEPEPEPEPEKRKSRGPRA